MPRTRIASFCFLRFLVDAARRRAPRLTHQTNITRRHLFVGAASALGTTALHCLWVSANAQSAAPLPVLGVQVLDPILSQPGWGKWIREGQIAPLHEGEIALLESILVTPIFGEAA